MSHIDYLANPYKSSNQNLTSRHLSALDDKMATITTAFHQSIHSYAPTPLHHLTALSEKLGVGAIYVKDESHRFGLNAFKGLGGAFAIVRYLADFLGVDVGVLSFDKLKSDEIYPQIKHLKFITCTDGNHGRGVAWACEVLGLSATVLMPKGSSTVRANNIRQHGASCTITEHSYDETVKLAHQLSTERGDVLLQDTAWDGYETIPLWIMQGYLTLAKEIGDTLDTPPTHVILQAGVGSFAAALLAYFVQIYADNLPTFIIAEPLKADCFFDSIERADGQMYATTGMLDTIMAGLACGTPSTIAWDIIVRHADAFVRVADVVSAYGMRVSRASMVGDTPFVSGESGAIGLGLVYTLCKDDTYHKIRTALGIDKHARLLMISTEGDTDATMYQKIIWDGFNPVG